MQESWQCWNIGCWDIGCWDIGCCDIGCWDIGWHERDEKETNVSRRSNTCSAGGSVARTRYTALTHNREAAAVQSCMYMGALF